MWVSYFMQLNALWLLLLLLLLLLNFQMNVLDCNFMR
jgi:hypothetical protein